MIHKHIFITVSILVGVLVSFLIGRLSVKPKVLPPEVKIEKVYSLPEGSDFGQVCLNYLGEWYLKEIEIKKEKQLSEHRAYLKEIEKEKEKQLREHQAYLDGFTKGKVDN